MNSTMVRLAEANVRTFIEFQNAFDECSHEIQEVVEDMIAVCRDPEATEDEIKRAIATITEALFPSLAADLTLAEKTALGSPSAVARERQMDKEEETFARRLRKTMKDKGLTQKHLAERAGVGQPAISNMLNRQCRPQRETVRRLAKALGVSPRDLWPMVE